MAKVTKKPAQPKKKQQKPTQAVHKYLAAHARVFTLLGGTAVVSLWTVLRHITNGINFDVVGQVGMAYQWAHGLHSGSLVGSTNYLLKLPFYFVVNHITFLSPMNRLLALALLFNIATFIALFWLLEAFARLYKVRNLTWLYLALAWLATVMGRVFWVDYANSRNLEVVGGMAFIYLTLRFIVRHRIRDALLIVPVGTIAFFADPLQFYVCGVGIVIYGLVRYLVHRTDLRLKHALLVIIATGLSYAGSQGLFWITKRFLPISYLALPASHPAISVANIIATARAISLNTVKIFDSYFFKSPVTFNNVRALLNALIVLSLVYAVLKLSHKKKYRGVMIMAASLWAANYASYIASGQALQWETSRYLVMVPIFGVMLVGLLGDGLPKKHRLRKQYALLACLAVSAVLLSGGLVMSWPQRHSKDLYVYNVVSFLKNNHYSYALSSRRVAIPGTYFAQGSSTVLPMICDPGRTLVPSNLFFDDAAFKGLAQDHKQVPIILEAEGIRDGSNHCSRENIIAQFGIPTREQIVPGVGTAEIYDAGAIHLRTSQLSGAQIDFNVGRQVAGSNFAEDTTLAHLDNCPGGMTDVVVAHQDDDLLFMNPSLETLVHATCTRTVYITASDDGRPAQYWHGREEGEKAAYAYMLGAPNEWTDKQERIHGHVITNSILNADPTHSLMFLRLPDGNVDGNGFESDSHGSLEHLSMHTIASLSTVDGQDKYTHDDLLVVVGSILKTDKPNQVLTTVDQGIYSRGDHSDHRTVGRLTMVAIKASKIKTLVSQFVGYPSGHLPGNISDDQAVRKADIFLVYAQGDYVICPTDEHCANETTYSNYFTRSYRLDSE